MGRVDEAMRRSAEKGRSGLRVLPDEPGSVAPEGTGAEAFPAEASEARRLRPVVAEPRESGPAYEASGSESRPLLTDRLSTALSGKVVIDREMDPASREQYRRLATKLHALQADLGLKVLAIVSAVASEGKSLTACNLALTLSESYQREVLLMDADLRRPSIDGAFGLPQENGLSEGLLPGGEQRLKSHRVTSRLMVLTSGRPTADPMAALTSERMRQLLHEARQAFDWVIVDTPPVGLLSDASLIAEMADGVLLVVRANSTDFDLVQRAVETLGKERIVGVVLNHTKDIGSAGGYQAYYAVAPTNPAGTNQA